MSCALKYLSKETLFDSIRSALSEKRLSSSLEIRVFTLCSSEEARLILQLRRSTYYFAAQLWKLISNANSAAVQNKLTFFSLSPLKFQFLIYRLRSQKCDYIRRKLILNWNRRNERLNFWFSTILRFACLGLLIHLRCEFLITSHINFIGWVQNLG